MTPQGKNLLITIIAIFELIDFSTCLISNSYGTSDRRRKFQLRFLRPASTAISSTLAHVWDHVLSKETCHELHSWTCSNRLRSDSHRVFQRNQPTNYIEQVLDAILCNLETTMTIHSHNTNNNVYVEYWSRQEWKHIEAHADVDEHLAKELEKTPSSSSASMMEYRYPNHGHVLYLQVGNQVRGPTCLFLHRSSGGDLIRGDKKIDVITVPAVAGRLLRFEGSMLHAVPRPTDIWLLPFVQGTSLTDPPEEWGRNVILFNTWHDTPPKDVPLSLEDTMEYEEETSQVSRNKLCNEWKEWQSSFVYQTPCHTMESSPSKSNESTSSTTAKVWLLGTTPRRNHLWRTVNLISPDESKLREALFEPVDSKLVPLLQP